MSLCPWAKNQSRCKVVLRRTFAERYLIVSIHVGFAQSSIMAGDDLPEEGVIQQPQSCSNLWAIPPLLTFHTPHMLAHPSGHGSISPPTTTKHITQATVTGPRNNVSSPFNSPHYSTLHTFLPKCNFLRLANTQLSANLSNASPA